MTDNLLGLDIDDSAKTISLDAYTNLLNYSDRDTKRKDVTFTVPLDWFMDTVTPELSYQDYIAGDIDKYDILDEVLERGVSVDDILQRAMIEQELVDYAFNVD